MPLDHGIRTQKDCHLKTLFTPGCDLPQMLEVNRKKGSQPQSMALQWPLPVKSGITEFELKTVYYLPYVGLTCVIFVCFFGICIVWITECFYCHTYLLCILFQLVLSPDYTNWTVEHYPCSQGTFIDQYLHVSQQSHYSVQVQHFKLSG